MSTSLGMIIFMLGGLAGAVFYLPFKKVTNWAWESYWFIYALFGLVIVPWIIVAITAPNTISILQSASSKEIGLCYIFGMAWGFGGLTWGLMIRYLGVGLGLALGCGICSATGTLLPPIFKGQWESLYATPSAKMALVGVVVSIIGIILIGSAGVSKEKELPEAEKKKAVAEYSFSKGIIAALFSGLMSAGMAFGLASGPEIQNIALAKGVSTTWQGMPVLVIVLLGGFTVNGIWCICLNLKNKTIGDYFNPKAPLFGNLVFAGLAGAIWVMQFVCQKAGEPRMGDQAYIGFAAVMASSILFSTILGILLGEWKGTGSRTKGFLAIGIIVLLGSSVVSGWSGYLKKSDATPNPVGNVEQIVNSVKTTAQDMVKDVKATAGSIENSITSTQAEAQKAGITNVIKVDSSLTNAASPAAPAAVTQPIEGADPNRK